MEAEGKVVPGLASRKGYRQYINSLAIADKKCIVDKAAICADEDDSADENESENESEERSKTKEAEKNKKHKARKSRWLHPDIRDILTHRWKDEGNNKEKE